LLLVLAVVLATAVSLPATALGIRVHVRVEGAHTTLFGASQPLLTPYLGPVATQGGGEVELGSPTPLGALEAASRAGELYYALVASAFGPYVSQIGRLGGTAESGWVYKVNGVSPPVGAIDYILEDGDEVLFYYATFGPTGGPLTLDLERAGRGCFQAFSVDDTGARTRALDVVFRIGSRAVEDADGRLCPRGHWHRIKVTKPGAIRSEVIAR
jgi:hypothetical protein